VPGNPRRVIGTMNDMKFALQLEAEGPTEQRRGRENSINRTPFSAIDYARPVDRFIDSMKGNDTESGRVPRVRKWSKILKKGPIN
jgi:hypothetical protein